MKEGDGFHPAVGVQSWDESGNLAELIEGKEVPVRAADGCYPAVGVQS